MQQPNTPYNVMSLTLTIDDNFLDIVQKFESNFLW
jgi:hypothetical protein